MLKRPELCHGLEAHAGGLGECEYIYIYIYTYKNAHSYMCIYIQIRMSACIYVYVCVYVYMYASVYIPKYGYEGFYVFGIVSMVLGRYLAVGYLGPEGYARPR